jgi:hypothetical protein
MQLPPAGSLLSSRAPLAMADRNFKNATGDVLSLE